jgi:hypothetical protein
MWYKDTKGITQFNTTVLQNKGLLHKLTIELKDNQGRIITEANTDIRVSSTKSLATIGKLLTKKTQVGTVTGNQTIFSQTSLFQIQNGKVEILFYLTTKAGADTITIDIPGSDPFKLNLTINPADPYEAIINLNQDSMRKGETLIGTIHLQDRRGNTTTRTTTIQTTPTENLTTTLPATTILTGTKTFTLTAKEGGVGYLIVDIQGTGLQTAIAKVGIEEILMPTSGLNILYLNYFGNDRGNQRGYLSDNKKYIEKLMTNSEKIITTTTQLIEEDKIKEVLRKIDPNRTVQDYGNL